MKRNIDVPYIFLLAIIILAWGVVIFVLIFPEYKETKFVGNCVVETSQRGVFGEEKVTKKVCND